MAEAFAREGNNENVLRFGKQLVGNLLRQDRFAEYVRIFGPVAIFEQIAEDEPDRPVMVFFALKVRAKVSRFGAGVHNDRIGR